MAGASQRKASQTFKRKELLAKLNPTCLRAFKSAADTAKMRGNPYVELVHWIEQLALSERSDFALIVAEAEIDPGRLAADITRALDKLPYGSTSVEEFSDHIFHATQEAWSYGSLEFGDETVRSGYVLLGALGVPVLEGLLLKISPEFDKIDRDDIAARLDDVLDHSLEAAPVAGPTEGGEKAPRKAPGGQSALSQFATDLTQRARDGKIDPVVGRDPEIRQIIDVLMRRRQNNPILTGEAGVGKTAVVEGFALRIARGDVPPMLENVSLYMLDVGLMQAGASVKGEFEKRLKSVIDEVQNSEKPIILFIDEAHTLIGAGGAAGTGDAANLLKPALARGELRTVAATTWAEYKEHIEKDPALTRRFQVVKVDEPSEEAAVLMMRGLAGVLEKHHKVQILDEALEASVSLSHRYIPARQLPDKSISLLDTACARVAVSQHATPAEVEDLQRKVSAYEIEIAIIEREEAIGIDVGDRAVKVTQELELVSSKLVDAEKRWEAEKELVDEILELRAKLRGEGAAVDETAHVPDADQIEAEGDEEGAEAAPAPEPKHYSAEEKAADLEKLKKLQDKLAEDQGESPLILPSVDRNAVAAVAQDWTGIPMGRMLTDSLNKALGLTDLLNKRVCGQEHAMEMIARRVQTHYAGIGAPNKPIGVFMLCGPSGVGKTETALALAEALYGGEQNIITINMSEFQEAHTVSTLKGAPPGYVGYGKGGILTEAVRRKPYSVILLDEVEKAHPDVHEMFFQVFDKGMMDDSEGREIDFKNTLILLTSNVGTETIMDMCQDGKVEADMEELTKALREPLLKVFPAALLGRIVTIPYYPLSDKMIETIAGLQINRIRKRLESSHEAELVIGDGVMDLIKSRCTEIESGGRMIDNILTNSLLPQLSRGLLNRGIEGLETSKVTVGAEKDAFTFAYE